jgi:hypothetical protein
MKHINTLCEQNAQVFNVKRFGASSNQKLKVVNLIMSETKSWASHVARTAQKSNT